MKLEYDKLLSTVAFKFNLRRYTEASAIDGLVSEGIHPGFA